MKILWHSNAWWNSTGYGIQTRLIVPRLKALGHEIVAVAAPFTFGGAILDWDGVPVLPGVADMAGADTIKPNHQYYGADVTITLCDPFMFYQVPHELKQITVAHWFPVDCRPVGKTDITVLREGGGMPIAMSQFGHRMLTDEGCDPLYVPHCVDTNVFTPGSPEPYRETTPGDEGTFIIGINAMNRDEHRKGWGEQFEAFARFHAKIPDSFLAVNACDVNPKGLDLRQLALRLGISDAVLFPDTYAYNCHLISEQNIVDFYRGIDVLSMCSWGEGFGIPLIEAQSCGTPVICTDASAMTELCGAGWLVKGSDIWEAKHHAWWVRPDVDDIYQAYMLAYHLKQDGALPGQEAREFALQYDADLVALKYWAPALAAIPELRGT